MMSAAPFVVFPPLYKKCFCLYFNMQMKKVLPLANFYGYIKDLVFPKDIHRTRSFIIFSYHKISSYPPAYIIFHGVFCLVLKVTILSGGKTFISTNVNDFKGAAERLGEVIEIWLLMIARKPQTMERYRYNRTKTEPKQTEAIRK